VAERTAAHLRGGLGRAAVLLGHMVFVVRLVFGLFAARAYLGKRRRKRGKLYEMILLN
jgi:hypothetical protein